MFKKDAFLRRAHIKKLSKDWLPTSFTISYFDSILKQVFKIVGYLFQPARKCFKCQNQFSAILHFSIKNKKKWEKCQKNRKNTAFMLTLEFQCILVVGEGVFVSRTKHLTVQCWPSSCCNWFKKMNIEQSLFTGWNIQHTTLNLIKNLNIFLIIFKTNQFKVVIW